MRWSMVLPLALGAVFLGVALWMANRPSPPQALPQASPTPAPTGAPGPPSAATQASEGQVTIVVTWPGPQAGLLFTVTLDTHSVNLDGYDLSQLAVLRTDQGREAQPTSWEAPPGGHHRQGTLSFPATAADGRPLLEPATRRLELVIRNLGDIPERTLRWTITGSDQPK